MMEAVSASVGVPLDLITWGYLYNLCQSPSSSSVMSPAGRSGMLANLALPPTKFESESTDARIYFSIRGKPGEHNTMESFSFPAYPAWASYYIEHN